MASASCPACPRRLTIALMWLALTGAGPVVASEIEREQLAALTRQLELADRLAEQLAQQTARSAPEAGARYHFDYPRLRADLARVRSGLQDYLSPQRAQPRDLSAPDGDYTREAGPSGEHKDAEQNREHSGREARSP